MLKAFKMGTRMRGFFFAVLPTATGVAAFAGAYWATMPNMGWGP